MASLAEFINDNYPSPADGDSFDWGGVRYNYNSAAGIWHSTLPDLADLPGDAAVQATAPESPNEGDIWFNGDRLMVRADSLWVDASPQFDPANLDLTSNLTVNGSGTSIPAVNTINVATGGNSGDGSVQVSPGTTGVVNLRVTFPEIPDVPSLPAVTMQGGQGVSQSYVSVVASDGTQSYVPLATAVGDLSVSTLSDIDTTTTAPTDGQSLMWDQGMQAWMPGDPPDTSNAISYDSTTDTLTINGVNHQIPRVSGATLNGSSLTIAQQGANPVVVDLASLGSGDSTPDNTITVNGSDNVSTISFPAGVASVSGSVATITLPDETPLVIRSEGTASSADTNSIDFRGDGVSVNNLGNGQVQVTIEGSTGGGSGGDTPTVTAVSNIDTVTSFVGWNDVTDRSQFTLTGRSGGSVHKVVLKNNTNSSIQLKYITSGDDCTTATMNGARSYGVWDPDVSAFRYFTEGTTSSALVWNNNSNRPIASREVVYLEVHLVENGNFQIISNSSSLTWYEAAEIVDIDATEIVDVPDSATPPEPPAPVETVGEVSDNHLGLFAPTGDASFEDAEAELPWGNLGFSDYVNALFSEQMGGNGTNSPRSTNGNDYWGTDSNRARSGIWQEAWGRTISGDDPQNHGISVVLPTVDPSDPVISRINQYANDQSLWQSHLIIFLRDDSALERGSNGLLIAPNATLQTSDNGANRGQRQGIRSLSGPGNGPFSDQYSFSAASGNFFAGYDYEYMYNIPGSTPLSERLRHQYNRVAFNIPNDPDNAAVEIRRRGMPIENDPLLSGTLSGVSGYFVGTNPGLAGVVSPISDYLGETKMANNRERRLTLDFPLEQFAGSTSRERLDNAVIWSRAVVGTRITVPGNTFDRTVKRFTLGTGYRGEGQEVQLDTSGNWVRINFMTDEDGPILTGLTPLTDAERTARGIPANPSGAVPDIASADIYGPLTFRREVPLATIVDPRGGVSRRDDEYQLAQARLWQIEYRLLL